MHYLIQDSVFEKIMKFLKTVKGIHKANVNRLREFIEAAFYMLKSGCQWRLLPYYYGDWRAVHKRFHEWVKRNIWHELFKTVQIDPDMEWVSIDSSIVRAHACAAGYRKDSQVQEALGRSRGGFSTKIHAVSDALGNPLDYLLTCGQRNDITQAKTLTSGLNGTIVIADKGYDSDGFINVLKDQGCDFEIPSRSNRKEQRTVDEYLYAERHTIECMFGKIKHFRRIFSRFDKSAKVYLAFLQFAGALIWLR